MTPTLHILCIEDENDVREAVLRDLAAFENQFELSGASDAAEAREIIEGMDPEKDRVALIFCDHIMPGQRGIDLLIELKLSQLEVLNHTRTVLFTGQADHADTIQAINHAGIAHFLAKPWEVKDLHDTTRTLLTDYVIDSRIQPLPFMAILDAARLAQSLHDRDDLDEIG